MCFWIISQPFRAAKRKAKKDAKQQAKELKALKKNTPVVEEPSEDILDDISSNDSGLEDVELEGKWRWLYENREEPGWSHCKSMIG